MNSGTGTGDEEQVLSQDSGVWSFFPAIGITGKPA